MGGQRRRWNERLLFHIRVAFHGETSLAAKRCAHGNFFNRLPEQADVVADTPSLAIKLKIINQRRILGSKSLFQINVRVVHHHARTNGKFVPELYRYCGIDSDISQRTLGSNGTKACIRRPTAAAAVRRVNAQPGAHRYFLQAATDEKLGRSGELFFYPISFTGVGGAICRPVSWIIIKPVNAGTQLSAGELGKASRIIVDGGWIIRRGHKRFAARGSKRVLTRQPQAVAQRRQGHQA